MKQLRKLTCLTLAIALMLSNMTFVHAASQEARNLNKLGLLLNITEEELGQTLNRVIGITMVLKALGYKDEDVKSKASDNPFMDLDRYSWAKGFAAVAYDNKITNGVSLDPNYMEFGPTEPLTKKQMLTFMLRVLGYDENEGIEAWEDTENLARKAGILTDNSEFDSHFTKDDAARIMYAAMSAKLQKSEGRLIDRLIAKGKVEKSKAMSLGLVEPEKPKTLEVESVTAENLRQIKVVFNREVNADSAKLLANYKLAGAKGVSSRTLSEAVVQEDNRTVLLTVGVALSQSANPSVLENRKDYVLTVKDVKDLTGQVLSKTEKNFTATDSSAPEVLGVEFTGPKNVRLTFTEPVKTLGKVKVMQGSSSISTRKVEIDSAHANVINVEVYNNFKAGVSYSFEATEMKDFAGYVNIIYVESKVYEADNSTPTARVVAADQGKVEVVFDRPVKGISEKHFYHSYPHQTAQAVYKDSALKQKVSSTEYVSKVWVVFATGLSSGNYPLPAQAEFYIMGKVNALQIMDSWGNKFADFREYLSVSADHSAPVIETVDVQSETQIVITYNKALSTAGTYKIIDSNGRTLANPSASLNGKMVTLKFSRITNKSSVILEIRGVKDNTLSRNEMPLETRAIEFTDKSFDGVASADFKAIMDGSRVVGGEIYVNYNEEVADNAIDPKNYRLEIGSLQETLSNQSFSFVDSNKAVLIVLNEVLAKKVSDNLGATKLIVGGVTDLAGNSSFGFQTTTPLTGIVAATMTKAVLVQDGDLSKVELHFNRSIYNILKANGITASYAQLRYDNTQVVNGPGTLRVVDYTIKGDNNKVVEVTLSDDIYMAGSLTLHVDSNTLEDSHGTKVASFSVTNVEDKIAPKMRTENGKKIVAAYKDGGNYYISLKYTESIDPNSLSSATYRIDGTDSFTIDGRPNVWAADDNVVVIKVLPKTGANFSDNFTLTQTQAITDKSGNRLEAENEVIEVVRESSWQ